MNKINIIYSYIEYHKSKSMCYSSFTGKAELRLYVREAVAGLHSSELQSGSKTGGC